MRGFGPALLFLLHGIGMAAWFVPLSPVLEAHGYSGLRPYAFATSAVAALVTPLLFGALADRRLPPLRVLRGVCFGTAVLMALAGFAIERRWPAWAVLGLIQLQSLLSTPTWSLVTSIVLSGLRDAKREFGPVRAFGTFGWIGGCLLVSVAGADASTRAGYLGAGFMLGLALFTLALPCVAPVSVPTRMSVRQRLGLDALELLRNPDHRVVFLTAGLLSAPLAAFYPFTPSQLRDLGMERTSAWMSLAQGTEVVAMYGLAALLGRWRLKWVLAAGLGFAVLRYLLLATNGRGWVLAGISLHGFAFTLFYVTAPIYLNERIDPAWRARGQALLSLMTQGLGNLVGYLGSGWWLAACQGPGGTRWTLFWGGLAGCVILVLGYFLARYRGREAHAVSEPAPP
jgi:MFS family permease